MSLVFAAASPLTALPHASCHPLRTARCSSAHFRPGADSSHIGLLDWEQQAKLTAADGEGNDYFAWSVALAGDTALVGAYVDDVGANENQGAAYFYKLSYAIYLPLVLR